MLSERTRWRSSHVHGCSETGPHGGHQVLANSYNIGVDSCSLFVDNILSRNLVTVAFSDSKENPPYEKRLAGEAKTYGGQYLYAAGVWILTANMRMRCPHQAWTARARIERSG
jgi:hypothetical protein